MRDLKIACGGQNNRWFEDWIEWRVGDGAYTNGLGKNAYKLNSQAKEFNTLVNTAKVEGVGCDTWLRLMETTHNFSVKSTYSSLHNLRIGSHENGVFKLMWHIKIRHKVSFMVWRLLHDRLPAKVYLHRRHIQLQEGAISCVLCNENDEDVYHAIFSCQNAHSIWGSWYRMLDISTVSLGSVIEHFSHNSQGRYSPKARETRWCSKIHSI
ncbi:hypothetical protein HKD37_08G021993 [Glycine soja]